jgi:hypothetical protein
MSRIHTAVKHSEDVDSLPHWGKKHDMPAFEIGKDVFLDIRPRTPELL